MITTTIVPRWRLHTAELFVLASVTAVFLITLVWNKFPPLMSWDSRWYLDLDGEYRPILYGVFLYVTSLGYSLIFSALFQAAILVLVLRRWSYLYGVIVSRWHFLLLCTVLGGVSSVGFFASFISPDVFLPIGLLALLICMRTQLLTEKILTALLVIVVIGMHLAHPPIFAIFAIFLALYYGKHYRSSLVLLLQQWAIVAAGSLLIPFSAYIQSGSFGLPSSSYMIPLASYFEAGIAQSHLREHCSTAHYIYCDKQKELEQAGLQVFLWEWEQAAYNSAFIAKYGPDKHVFETRRLLHDLQERYIGPKVARTLRTLLQVPFVHRDSRLFPSLSADAYPYDALAKNLPNDTPRMENSRLVAQYNTARMTMLDFLSFAMKLSFISLLSLLIARMLPSKVPVLERNVKAGFDTVLAFAVCNGFICTFFASPVARYFQRLHWLFTLLLLVALWNLVEEKLCSNA